MKKSEKNRNLRLRYLLILLLICAIVFVSSTYAWFTSNKEVQIDTIQVNVRTSAGIQISADGVNWKSALTLNDLTAAKNTYSELSNHIPANIEPVSTAMNIITNGKLDMYYGEVKSNDAGNFALTAVADNDFEAAHYVVFDIFLKTNSPIAAEDILIDCSGLNAEDRSGVYISGTESALGIENASRIAFINEGNIEDGSTGSAIRALTASADADKYLWEPNANTHTNAGISNAENTYGLTGVTATGPTSLDYDGVKAEIVEANAVELAATNATANSAFFADVTPDQTTTKAYSDTLPFMALEAGITKIRIYMWIEGQDVDCENNASGALVNFNLRFKLKEDTNG